MPKKSTTRANRATTRAEPRTIQQLVANPQNARRHPERNLEMIATSLRDVGAARSIVIDETNGILAGEGVTRAAAAAGLTRLRVIDGDGDELVAVRRRGLTPDQKTRLALYDNRTGELAEWDAEILDRLVAAGTDLSAFWSKDELDQLLEEVHRTTGLMDPDAVPEERPTDIVEGDLFELGRHRLLCGDSTRAADIERLLAGAVPPLMVTDPPYGVDYDPSWRLKAGVSRGQGKLGKVLNDDQADWTEAWRLFPGAAAYVWHAGLQSSIVQSSLERAQFTLRAQIIWAKDRLALSRGDYHWQHEPCWYGVRDGRPGRRTADRSQSTLWRIETPSALEHPPEAVTTVWEIPTREDGGHGHGTQKPVECMARPMRNHHAPEIFEPFCGSGSSIIAAETLGRRCYANELNPTYVQLDIDRWEAFTGKTAVKVGEATRA